MEFPASLSHWKEALAVVSPEVGALLGDWLRALASAVGSLRIRVPHGTSTPDGYDGLARRGPYERMLLSEWLWAEEAPEEFVRRAVARELAFYRMAYRESAEARASVVLFDAGPSQLGVPRLAHIAALLVLAQRAASVKARFEWGVLQRPPEPSGHDALLLGVTTENVNNLLFARSASTPTDDDLRAWATLVTHRARRDDVWIVGARDVWLRWCSLGFHRTGSTGGAFVVADAYELEGQRVAVTVLQHATETAVMLTPPDDAICTRLLHSVTADTSGTSRKSSSKPSMPRGRRYTAAHAPASSLIFRPDGRGLAWRTVSGALVYSSIPHTPGASRGRLQIFVRRRGETILGVGWVRSRLVFLTLRVGELLLYEWNGSDFPRDAASRPWPAWVQDPDALSEEMARDLTALFVYRATLAYAVALRLPDDTLVRLDRDAVRLLRPPSSGDVFVRNERLVVEGPLAASIATRLVSSDFHGVESVESGASLALVSTFEEATATLAAHPELRAAIVASPGASVIARLQRGAALTVLRSLRAPVTRLTLEPRVGLLAVATQHGDVLVLDVLGDRGTLLEWTYEAVS